MKEQAISQIDLPVNNQIRATQVRLIGPAGQQVGIINTRDALNMAEDIGLDLVLVSPDAEPPVAKILDYSKFRYEASIKEKASRKAQVQTTTKEIKLRPRIDTNDFTTKSSQTRKFLAKGDKVKVTVMFRGREQSHPEIGYRLLEQMAAAVEGLATVERAPAMDGRNLSIMLVPAKN